MKSRGKLSRRSFLGRVVGGAVVGGGAIVALTSSAKAQVTDSDPGDPANRTGLTDQDPSDPAGNGRGNGVTDNDQGTNSDPARCGRR